MSTSLEVPALDNLLLAPSKLSILTLLEVGVFRVSLDYPVRLRLRLELTAENSLAIVHKVRTVQP